jgi:hypothetical protein
MPGERYARNNVANIGDVKETEYDQPNFPLQKFPHVRKNSRNRDKP